MKKTLAALLMAGASLIGCDKPKQKLVIQPIEQTVKVQRPVSDNQAESEDEAQLRKLIEKEMRKQDAWAADVVRQNYTTAEGTEWVSLVREKKMKSEKLIGHIAAYSEKDDQIILPMSEKPEEDAQLIDAVDHELWHVIFDHEGNKGVFFGKNYKGPTEADVTAHCNAKMMQPEYAKLKQDVNISLRLDAINRKINDLASFYSNLLIQSLEKQTKISKELEEMPEKTLGFISEADRTKANETLQRVQESYTKLREEFMSLKKWYEQSLVPLGNSALTPERISSIEKEVEQKASLLQPHASLGKDTEKASDLIYTIVFAAQDKAHEARVAELKKQIEANEFGRRETYEKRLNSENKFHELSKEMRSLRKMNLSDLNMSRLDSVMGELKGSLNEQRLNDIFSPNETMARIVDAMYSLDFGQPTLQKFQPSENDLEFLLRFTYRGQPLFRKGVEKYRLGIQMTKDGITPEKIKEQLEYATEFSYKGKTYSWPETDFRIKGSIPHDEKD